MRLAFLVLLLASCNGPSPAPVQQKPASAEDLLRGNRDAIRLEDRDINLYIERYALDPQRSGTGVRHQLLRDEPGTAVKPGQWALVRYRMELLNGDTAYTSDPSGPEGFMVEEDNVESGLHEAIQHLSPGDSAIIIIPSYRAHGLIGDMDRVPPRSTVVYRIGLAGIRE
ncbi:MAG TPA: FKBP-type peptidyl-prolyl cis-trans isomerase [Flavobacteriales bacterium]|nr:FKBP-type peptidyl-prolyl cis-trans isomerase [Flavobacteriales bacterium]